jgi:hypothetical protein
VCDHAFCASCHSSIAHRDLAFSEQQADAADQSAVPTLEQLSNTGLNEEITRLAISDLGILTAENSSTAGRFLPESIHGISTQGDTQDGRKGPLGGHEVHAPEATIAEPLLPTSNPVPLYLTIETHDVENHDPSSSAFHTTLLDELRFQDWVKLSDRWNLEHLVSDIGLIGIENIRISYEAGCGWRDTLKVSIENWTSSTWDWWPLKPPRSRRNARVFWPGVNISLL